MIALSLFHIYLRYNRIKYFRITSTIGRCPAHSQMLASTLAHSTGWFCPRTRGSSLKCGGRSALYSWALSLRLRLNLPRAFSYCAIMSCFEHLLLFSNLNRSYDRGYLAMSPSFSLFFERHHCPVRPRSNCGFSIR